METNQKKEGKKRRKEKKELRLFNAQRGEEPFLQAGAYRNHMANVVLELWLEGSIGI